MTGMSERLTDEECEDLLIAAHTVEPMHHVGNALFAAVERILASRDARLAAVEALAERWDGVLTECKQADPRWILDRSITTLETARDELRAALRSDPSEERGQS